MAKGFGDSYGPALFPQRKWNPQMLDNRSLTLEKTIVCAEEVSLDNKDENAMLFSLNDEHVKLVDKINLIHVCLVHMYIRM